mgnify:FL=1
MIARIAAEVRREWAPWMGHKALQEVAEEIDEEYREEVVQEVLRQADIWRARQRPQQMEGRQSAPAGKRSRRGGGKRSLSTW